MRMIVYENIKYNRLQNVPFPNPDGESYEASVQCHTDSYETLYEKNKDIFQCIRLHQGIYEEEMLENGMDKFTLMLSGMLFEIKQGDVTKEFVTLVLKDIKDFETGEYDHLFNAEDLTCVKRDINIIKEYVNKHPELLEK